ncbi:SRPBCC family protein [Amycolatopsis jejuensis]|uniref:SRPBCC family protein n=1 Tax=Amycolatopsis jejuensis TaxID=330084 RepID=UPI000690B78F|nr:SRPBCC family protein [Amycolatopsis jejuensis]
MIEAATPRVPANPEGADVTLTTAHVWQALVWKAEFAHLFVKPIKECRVIERFGDGFLREILHEDSQGRDRLYERIFLEDEKTVRFLRLNGPVYGEIVNTLTTIDDTLALDFSFTLGIAGETHGSQKEKEYQEEFLRGYVIAAEATLEAAREYVRTGVDPTAAA